MCSQVWLTGCRHMLTHSSIDKIFDYFLLTTNYQTLQHKQLMKYQIIDHQALLRIEFHFIDNCLLVDTKLWLSPRSSFLYFTFWQWWIISKSLVHSFIFQETSEQWCECHPCAGAGVTDRCSWQGWLSLTAEGGLRESKGILGIFLIRIKINIHFS